MIRGDDEVKRELEIDLARSEEAYAACDGDTDALESIFGHNFFRPQADELSARQDEIDRFLQGGNLRLVVPMREPEGKADEVEGVLRKLVRQLPPGKVLVVDNGSDAKVVATTQDIPGVRLVSRNDVFERLLERQRLLTLLNPPDGKLPDRGKGLTVLAGYLCSYFLDEVEGKAKWLGQCDAEIAGFDAKETDEGVVPGYQCLEHLVWGMLEAPQGRYYKMAMPCRGNERCIQKRLDLLLLSQKEFVPPRMRQRLREIALRTGPHLWMLTGEFILHRELAYQRPFATGYLEETLTAMFVEDIGAEGHPGRNGYTVQVYNPNQRSDADNSSLKETVMQTQIGCFLQEMAEHMGLVNTWTLQDITTLNCGYMAKPLMVFWPHSNAPSHKWPPLDKQKPIYTFENDRIIPSVEMLIESGFVNVDAGRRFAEELLEQERSTLG